MGAREQAGSCFRGRASPGACPGGGEALLLRRQSHEADATGFTFSTIKNHLKSFFFN